APHPDQGSRSRSGRGVEVERGSGVVARRVDLHRRDLQERREDDLRQGGSAEGSLAPLQLQSRGEHKACHRLPRRRRDQRGGVEDSNSRLRAPEQVQVQTLIHRIRRRRSALRIATMKRVEEGRKGKPQVKRAARASAGRKPTAKIKKIAKTKSDWSDP